MPTKQERLAEVFRRLEASAPASDHDSAFELVRDVMNAVEDELSGIPYDPEDAGVRTPSRRMYPPLLDSERPAIIPGTRQFEAARHEILVGSNGAILIQHKTTKVVELSKVGADGKAIAP